MQVKQDVREQQVATPIPANRRPGANRRTKLRQSNMNMIGRTSILIALILFVCPVKAQTAQEVAKKAFASTVLLVMEDKDGQTLSLGSGFLLKDGQIVTNVHVIKGAARGYAKLIGAKAKHDIDGVLALDEERDLALLKVSGVHGISVTLGDSDMVEIGQTVYAVGNPQGLEGTFSQGILSGIRQDDTNKLLQITAPISPGSSGGPVLNSRGQVIGVSVSTYKEGQNLNFAIPSNYLKSLLIAVGPSKSLSQLAETRFERSLTDKLGEEGAKALVGGQWMWTYNSDTGYYSFSLRNQLRQPVSNVYCLVIFYDDNNNPVDVDVIQQRDVIPAGLAKRFTSKVDSSVQSLSQRAIFRVLDFELLD